MAVRLGSQVGSVVKLMSYLATLGKRFADFILQQEVLGSKSLRLRLALKMVPTSSELPTPSGHPLPGAPLLFLMNCARRLAIAVSAQVYMEAVQRARSRGQVGVPYMMRSRAAACKTGSSFFLVVVFARTASFPNGFATSKNAGTKKQDKQP